MSGSHSTEPELARKNLIQRPGAPLLFVSALLLIACTVASAQGHLPQIGSVVQFLRLGQSPRLATLSPMIFGILGLAAFLILIGVLRAVGYLFQRARQRSPLAGRPEKALDQFVTEATADRMIPASDGTQPTACISARVAREGYNLLERFYPKPVCIELQDDLRDDVGLVTEQIVNLRSSLLRHADRREDNDASVTEIRTVKQLLQNAENAPLQHLNTSANPIGVVSDRSGTRTRATDLEQVAGSRESKAASMSGPQIHASSLRRRSADYSGPRRRGTDKLPEPVYRGPFRRINDPASGSRPRATTSGERRIEQTSAELSKLGPLFSPRRNRPKPPEGS